MPCEFVRIHAALGRSRRGVLQFIAGGTWLLAGIAGAGAEPPVLDHVTVQGTAEGAYLSELAATASKLPLSRLETPVSISVLTRAQMDEQNMVTTWDALQQITGITAISNDLTQSQFHARGAALDLQFDGVPSAMQLSGYKQLDLSVYDRIEVQRGPAGLLQGSGSFGGTVNMVRKRAMRERMGSLLASAGTWNNLRAEGDFSTPLNDARTLRARAVASIVDREFVFDRVHSRRRLAFVTADYDLGASTTATAYFAWQDDKGPGFSGLPTYTDGRFLDVPRSFNHLAAWNRMAWRTRDTGLELRHAWLGSWQLTARLGHRDQGQMFHDAFTSSGVDPQAFTARYSRREFKYAFDGRSIDAFLSGDVPFLGRTHSVLVGYNQGLWRTTGWGVNPTSDPSLYVSDVVVGSPPDVPEPEFAYRTGSQDMRRQHGFYSQLRASIAEPLTLMLGGRLTSLANRARAVAPSAPTAWARGAHVSSEFTPFAGVTWTPAANLAVYGNYAEVFVPQTQQRVTGETLAPRAGRQLEMGAKANLMQDQLHATVAVFNIRDHNRAYADEANPGFFLPMGLAQSEGAEIELVGRPADGWQLSAGYTYLDTRYLRHASQQGRPLNGLYPTHALKLWGTHTFSGQWSRLRLGAGVRAQSRTAGATAASAGVQAGRQRAYAVVSLSGTYAFSTGLIASVNVENLFDARYYTRLGGLNSYNTFGDPRNATLSVKWSL